MPAAIGVPPVRLVAPACGMPLRIASWFIGATEISTTGLNLHAVISYFCGASFAGNRLAPKLMVPLLPITMVFTTWYRLFQRVIFGVLTSAS